MPAAYGQVSTYSDSSLGNLHISIEDLVGKYPKKDFPLLNRLNGKIFDKEVDNPKYQWKEEVLRPTKDVLESAISSTSATTITATTSGVFNVDDIILIDSEYMVVTAVSGGVTLTVVRGWNSTAATHLDAATMLRVGVAAPEGADADGPVTQALSDLYNMTQIFEDVVQLTGTEEEAFLYRTNEGNDNASNQITKKQQELMEMLQTAIILGVRNDDTATKRRSMGGIKFLIDTYASANAVSMGGASSWTTETSSTLSGSGITVAQQKIDDVVQALIYERSKPSAIYAGYKAIRKMMAWDAVKTRTDRDDDTKGYKAPAHYLSQAGELDIVFVPGDALNDAIFIVDESRLGYKAFKNRGWFTERLAKTGDSSKWQVLGEYTVKVSTPKVHGYLHTLGL